MKIQKSFIVSIMIDHRNNLIIAQQQDFVIEALILCQDCKGLG